MVKYTNIRAITYIIFFQYFQFLEIFIYSLLLYRGTRENKKILLLYIFIAPFLSIVSFTQSFSVFFTSPYPPKKVCYNIGPFIDYYLSALSFFLFLGSNNILQYSSCIRRICFNNSIFIQLNSCRYGYAWSSSFLRSFVSIQCDFGR